MYDIIVVGAGPGGYAAAIRASQLGQKAAIVEEGKIGGTCVNRGCVPAKVWHRAARELEMIRKGAVYGIDASVEKINLETLVERKNGVSAEIRMGMEGLLANYGVELISGRGIFKNPSELLVGKKTYSANTFIIATGSRLAIPDIPGMKDAVMTTDELLETNRLPSSVLVWGAGHIEVEMAGLLNTFGSTVTLATDSDRILPGEDHDTSQRVAQALREQGISFIVRSNLKEIIKKKKRFVCKCSGSKETDVEVDRVLVASREPNSSDMGLEQAGVSLNERGVVTVSDTLETSAKNIYGIGDAVGGWMVSQAASAMAVTAVQNATGGSEKFSFNQVPRGVWTSPEIGAVGLSEEEAEKQGRDVEVGSFPYSINGLAMCRDEVDGAVKIVSDDKYGEILGVHIVGSHATELIGEAVLAMQLECTVQEFAKGIRVHPTFSEAIVDSAREAKKWALYLPKE